MAERLESLLREVRHATRRTNSFSVGRCWWAQPLPLWVRLLAPSGPIYWGGLRMCRP